MLTTMAPSVPNIMFYQFGIFNLIKGKKNDNKNDNKES